MSDELEHELVSFDVPDGPPVDADWQRRCCECGDGFSPVCAKQIRCASCNAAKQDVGA